MKPTKQKKMIYDIIPRRTEVVVHVVQKNSRGAIRVLFSLQKQALALFMALLMVLINAHAFVAFEAHVVDVKAEVARVDAPLITPPGGNAYPDEVDVSVTSDDADATHVFYTVTPGTNANGAPDPSCTPSGVNLGGTKPISSFVIGADAVVKAVACTGSDADAHSSLVTLAVFDFPDLYAGIQGHKYHDTNKNEQFDPGLDFPIEGWEIRLLDQNFVTASTTVTDVSGFYYFKGVSPGTYMVQEEHRQGWDAITPPEFPVFVLGSEPHIYDFYNFDTGFACVPKDINFPYRLAVQAAGLGSENNDDVALGTTVTINGDVRSNDDIRRMASATNVVINGSATSTSDVDAGITVTKQKTTTGAMDTLPDVMTAEWKARAADGGVVNGSFVFPNNMAGIALGPVEISGNLKFGNANDVIIKGPVYVHGNVEFGKDTVIKADASFGDQFVPIIVDGLIDIGSGVSFVGAGTKGTFLLVSTHTAVSGDDAAIELASGVSMSDLGAAVLYAADGDVHVRSNRTIRAAFAAHGTGAAGDDDAAVRLDSNVTVNWKTLPNKISCGARQPFESTLHVVVNEFVPNPAGNDDAAKPAGEWVEIFNPTSSAVNLAGWVLYDAVNTHALPITNLNTNTGGTSISSKGRLVVYRHGDSDFELNNSGGDSVRLFSGLIGSGGFLVDSHTYTVSAPENKSFARIPDGSANWIDPDGTPGEANLLFIEGPDGLELDPSSDFFDPANKPELYIRDKTISELPIAELEAAAEGEPSLLADDTATSTDAVIEEKAKVEEPPIAELPNADAEKGGGSDGSGSNIATTTPAGDSVPESPSDTTDTQNSGIPEEAPLPAMPSRDSVEVPVADVPSEMTIPSSTEEATKKKEEAPVVQSVSVSASTDPTATQAPEAQQ